jgi:hypothetical protein
MSACFASQIAIYSFTVLIGVLSLMYKRVRAVPTWDQASLAPVTTGHSTKSQGFRWIWWWCAIFLGANFVASVLFYDTKYESTWIRWFVIWEAKRSKGIFEPKVRLVLCFIPEFRGRGGPMAFWVLACQCKLSCCCRISVAR